MEQVEERCYPCSWYERACVFDEPMCIPSSEVPVSQSADQSGDRWFDVALWRYWPSASMWPEWTGCVVADNAFSAVVQLMHVYGLSSVEHATVFARDGSIVYRAYGVQGMKRGWVWFSGRKNVKRVVSVMSE